MNDLSRWKAALEKHGLEEVHLTGGVNDQKLYAALGTPYTLTIRQNDDDHSAAEFISRVTAKVFPGATFVEFGDTVRFVEPQAYNWIEHVLTFAFRVLASAPKGDSAKLSALLSALEDKTND